MTKKERWIQRIKDMGQEIVDRAEEIAPGEMAVNLTITVNFGVDSEELDTLEWHGEVYSKRQYERYLKGDM